MEGTPLTDAAEVIAVRMIEAAFAHLPVERAAGALAMANTDPIRDILSAVTIEAYDQGRQRGIVAGRLEYQHEMEDDWKPVAARIRAGANSPSYQERQRLTDSEKGSGYTGGPVSDW